MSDLSRLLYDVYGDHGASADVAPPAPTPALTGVPDWAMDSVLDEAFADWVPGSPSVVTDAFDADSSFEQVVGHPHRPAFGEPTGEPAARHEAASPWTRTHDDILPIRRGRSSGRLTTSRSAVVAPEPGPVATIESFAVDEEQAPSPRRRVGRRRS